MQCLHKVCVGGAEREMNISYVNMEAQQRPMFEEASWVKGDVSMETIKGVKHTKSKDAAVLKPKYCFCISLRGPLTPPP